MASFPFVPKSFQIESFELTSSIPLVAFSQSLKSAVIPPGPGIFSLNISAATSKVNVVLSVLSIVIVED